MQEYYSILTNYGLQKQIDCLANDIRFDIEEIAVGDGNGSHYEPEAIQTSLKREVWRGVVDKIDIENNGDNSTTLFAIVHIPADAGDFTIREAGVFDRNGKLVIVAKLPEIIKRNPETGDIKQLSIRIDLSVLNEVVLPYLIDPSINTATVEYCDKHYQNLNEKGKSNGYASLDERGLVPETQSPKIAEWGKIRNNIKDQTDLLNQCSVDRIYDSGISTDTEGYKKVRDLKHSQFDLSKVEVVGSPAISNDGVASGFSNSSYIKTGITIGQKPFKIICKFNSNSTTATNIIVDNLTGNSWYPLIVRVNNTITVYAQDSNGNQIYTGGAFTILTNTDYWVYLEFTGSKYILGLSLDGKNWTTKETANSNYIKGIESEVIIGRYGGFAQGAFDGSIDLKQFSITVDGQEIYNCLKTGIDTVKPDNYKVVGEPVISEDGVASGFSESDYLRFNLNLNSNSKIKIKLRIKIPSIQQTNACIFSGGTNNANRLFTQILKNTSVFQFGWGTETRISTPDLTPKLYYDFILDYESSKIYLQYKIASDYEYNDIAPVTVDETLDINNILIGLYTGQLLPFTDGSFDLNAFKIYVDGNLVYQPCLKLPYTEAVTGAKIVNAEYRNRVQDWYEQSGEGNYYTIDEENENFTLPLPDLYGLIESRVGHEDLLEVSAVIETYSNESSWYRVWSDGWIEQGGKIPANVGSNYITNLLKPFKDTDYSFISAIVPTSKQIDSFTCNQTLTYEVDWSTKGYGA